MTKLNFTAFAAITFAVFSGAAIATPEKETYKRPTESYVTVGISPKAKSVIENAKTNNALLKRSIQYQCVKCHMQFNSEDAKKHHYKCPMDRSKLVLLTTDTKPPHSHM